MSLNISLPFSDEDLDARVHAVHVQIVANGFLAEEIDGRSIGRGRIGGHLQLVGAGLLPIGKGKSGERSEGEE